jgi:hypothetical protein
MLWSDQPIAYPVDEGSTIRPGLLPEDDPLAASRGCLFGVVGGVLIWTTLFGWLFLLGWIIGGIRFP